MKKLSYAIVFVSDMHRSVKFYRDILELPFKFESPSWSEFANEGTTIALHLTTTKAVAADGDNAGSCRLGFQVADLDAVHRDLLTKQVLCVSPPQVQQYEIRQAVYRDPDGLTFTLTQPPSHDR